VDPLLNPLVGDRWRGLSFSGRDLASSRSRWLEMELGIQQLGFPPRLISLARFHFAVVVNFGVSLCSFLSSTPIPDSPWAPGRQTTTPLYASPVELFLSALYPSSHPSRPRSFVRTPIVPAPSRVPQYTRLYLTYERIQHPSLSVRTSYRQTRLRCCVCTFLRRDAKLGQTRNPGIVRPSRERIEAGASLARST
jgi:hypothetical protein